MPGRSSVHRCPSRFTFRTAFFAAFFTATCTPSWTLPDTFIRNRPGLTHCRHRRVRTVEQQIFLNPNEEPVPRPHDDRWLNIQVPACYLDSQLADLLADRLAHLLAYALRLQHGGVRSLAHLDTGAEK